MFPLFLGKKAKKFIYWTKKSKSQGIHSIHSIYKTSQKPDKIGKILKKNFGHDLY
jgi:hypothetical protein